MKTYSIVWSRFAESELDKIYSFYSENAGEKVAKKLIVGIISETKRLVSNTGIGQVESILESLGKHYRYLVYKNYKLIYYLDLSSNQIRIVDVFDSRQNPIKSSVENKVFTNSMQPTTTTFSSNRTAIVQTTC